MIIAAIYPMFRRLRAFRWLASNTMWFDFHLMAGTVGPMFVALHSALKLSSWVSLAFWSMVIVALSGFIGRYLYTQVPELSSGRELEQLDHERAFAHHRGRNPVAMSEIDRELWEHGQRAGRVAAHAGCWSAWPGCCSRICVGPGGGGRGGAASAASGSPARPGAIWCAAPAGCCSSSAAR
jgi:hypothetical protein